MYAVTKDGKVWSYKKGGFLNQYRGKTSNYFQVNLSKNGISKHMLVHRLVALTYIKNPDKLPEVDHIDNNIDNNCVENLQWITRKDNLKKSYKTMSPVRNFKSCKVYIDGNLYGLFKSVSSAARNLSKNFGMSESSLRKYLKVKNVRIEIMS